MRQIPLPIGPVAAPSFASFVPGSNGAALDHLSGLAAPGAPVYLWGPRGSGKTHLLRALAARQQEAGAQVAFFDADVSAPWHLSDADALAVIDRCDELDAARQQAAFAVFVEAATQGVQVAAAGRLPPVDLPLREDLRTRLGWGHVFALQPLNEVETRAALRREADRRGIPLADEVLDYLMTRCTRDTGHLMALLDRLDGFALARSRAVTVPLVREMLAEDATS